MLSDDPVALWEEDQEVYGWRMPCAPRWKRLPIIRHARAMWARFQVNRHNAFWRSLGRIPTGYDDWVVFGIWLGREGEK